MLQLRIRGIWQNLITSAEVMTNQKYHLGCRDVMPVKTTQELMHKVTLTCLFFMCLYFKLPVGIFLA